MLSPVTLVRISLHLLLFGTLQPLSTQSIITGKVTDIESGESLPGVIILIEGTTNGTITSEDGEYTISVPEDAATLVFSFTGYATKTIPVGDQVVIDVAMEVDTASIICWLVLEKVVTDPGSVSKGQLDYQDFNPGNINDALELIQGKLAGVHVSKAGGNPNQLADIRIRGANSFGASQTPLVVIDGVMNADLSLVDPFEIEKIAVLKDGAATAIYGAQGSAGVLLVTTKSGGFHRGQLQYNNYFAIDQVGARPEVASSTEYLSLLNEVAGSNTRDIQDFGVSTDWTDEISRTGFSQVHNLNYSGTTKHELRYRAAVSYRDIEGVSAAKDGFSQLNARLKLSQWLLKDKIQLNANLFTTDRRADLINLAAFRYASTYNPAAPVSVNDANVRFPNGREFIELESRQRFNNYFEQNFFDYFNPVAILNEEQAESRDLNQLLSVGVRFSLVDNLSFSVQYSRERSENTLRRYATRESAFSGFARGQNVLRGFAERSDAESTTQLLEARLNYTIDLDQVDLDIFGGYSWQNIQASEQLLLSRGFRTNELGNELAFAESIDVAALRSLPNNDFSNFRGEAKLIGFFGSTRLGIGRAFDIVGSLRYDGSSRNGEDNRWHLYPALSARLGILELLRINTGSTLNLRTSYGVTGNLPNGFYSFEPRYSFQSNFVLDGTSITTLNPVTQGNPQLSPERKQSFNLGLDFTTLSGKLSGHFEYFDQRIRDLILPYATILPFRADAVNIQNLQLKNTGIELGLSYLILSNAYVQYQVGLNLTAMNSRLDDLGQREGFVLSSDSEIASSTPGPPGNPGHPVSQIRLNEEFGGLYTRVIDLASSRATGNWVFIDQDGDNEDPRNDSDDIVQVGNALPDFSLGFFHEIQIGKFDASLLFKGDFGHEIANFRNIFVGNAGNLITRPIDNVLLNDRFLREVTDFPTLSNHHVETASFLTLDNAQIGYTIEGKEKCLFSAIRPYLAGQNLFMLTNYSGFDPNVRYGEAGNPLANGIDFRDTYYRTRTLLVGVTVNFK